LTSLASTVNFLQQLLTLCVGCGESSDLVILRGSTFIEQRHYVSHVTDSGIVQVLCS
jgi:hypothetical protein